ncbi:MAG: MFS transporter [Clostridiales bacterium]|nr:MFS transporter [Clostridiales bacterium]
MGKKKNIIFSIIAISFLQGLQFIVSPVLDQIAEHFPEVSVSLVQMLITAPTLLSMIIAVVSGWLVVKISKKKLLLIAALTAGITGFLPFLADSFWLLFVSRVLYGIALGLATTLNTAVVAEHFQGDERVTAMGIQSASVGAGMVVANVGGGYLGSFGFTATYFLSIIAFLSFGVLLVCLPDTGKVAVTKTEKIRLNYKVVLVSLMGFLEYIFLISFSTNIAMHISGSLAGNSVVSGGLTGIFSGSQIVIGLLLGYVTKITKKYTISAAMLSLALGCVLLVLFPSSLIMLSVAAVFCGFSQGILVPTAMVEVSNAVPPAATAMAAACFTCLSNLGQFISPTVLNGASRVIYGETTTTAVYTIAAVGITLSAAAAFAVSRKINR